MESNNTNSTSAIDSSNIGFQLLKKHGWKEGTGLGSSQQGRLEPVEAYVKKNKRGLGADNHKTNTTTNNKQEKKSKKEKVLSKKMRKMLDEQKLQQEKELRRAFFREFWPDNV